MMSLLFLKVVFADELVIDRFSETAKGKTPKGWDLKVNKGEADLEVLEEDRS
jgi:hypothetical protein